MERSKTKAVYREGVRLPLQLHLLGSLDLLAVIQSYNPVTNDRPVSTHHIVVLPTRRHTDFPEPRIWAPPTFFRVLYTLSTTLNLQ